MEFLSTPSARRATAGAKPQRSVNYISIHALREEGDSREPNRKGVSTIFLSTPSARRATCQKCAEVNRSIDFYPRPPRGGRRGVVRHLLRQSGFLSTPSARRATLFKVCVVFSDFISIHALREEGDVETELETLIQEISIHALREEGDSKNRDKISIFKQIIQHSARI